MASTYKAIGIDDAYSACIKSFASVEVAGQSVYGGQSAQMDSLFGSLLSTGGSSQSAVGSDMVGQILGSLLSARSLPEAGLDEDEAGFIDAETVNNNEKYIAENQVDASKLVFTKKDGQDVISLSEEEWSLIQNIELNVFIDDGTGYIDLGLDNVFSFNEEGDLLRDYDGTWLCVNDQPVAYYMVSTTGTQEDYKIMGRIPAMLNGSKVDLIVCFTDEKPKGEILGAQPIYDEKEETETTAKGLIEIKDGDRIDFICEYYDYDRNFDSEYYLGDTLVVSGDLNLSDKKFDNSEYIAAYRFTDIYHNEYWTERIN